MHPNAISAQELTALFSATGALNSGSVASVEIDQQIDTIVSHLTFLKLIYSSDALPELPARMVLKTEGKGFSEACRSELEFYSNLAPKLASPPVLPWYLTTADGTLLLQDLRSTHTNTTWPSPPSAVECFQMIDALAQFHARWWEDPSLGVSVGSSHTTESLTSMVSGIADLVPGFCDAVDHHRSKAIRELLESVFGSTLRPWLRIVESRALTVTHGDTHCWNFLFPRESGGPVYLIDWQLWHVDVGARDLAFLIAAHWDSDLRRTMEKPLLEQYHRNLITAGIENYCWDDLWLDYRYGVVRNLTIPLLYWKKGMKTEFWKHRLECALAAYFDLGCDELV